jgi:flagellar hook protein FlgE
MSFQQGLSGLNAQSKQLEIIGNNIANANTYGSKVSRAEFADQYSAMLDGTGAGNIGIGVRLASVAQQFSQGNVTSTSNPLDLAINGNGFFQVTDGASPISYTRNGQFKVDREGYIANNSGLKLVGYPANDAGEVLPGAPGPLQLPTGGISPVATTGVDIEMNLDARDAVRVPAVAPPAIDFGDVATFNNATSVAVYDAKGQSVALTYYFQKAANDSWNVFATANGSTIAGSDVAPDPIGTIDFTADGSAIANPVGPIVFDVPVQTNSVGAETLPILGVELNLTGTTQYGASFAVTNMQQDGFAPGQLTSLSVDADGLVLARYSNGQSKPAGQIELATFRNPQGLAPVGDNTWAITRAAGDPVRGVPGQGNLGQLQAGALEESNIDLTGELVAMITAQRSYQANAQTIKTMDQVLQTLVNIR